MEFDQGQISAFSLSDAFESINNGVSKYNMDQLYPMSGNINTAVVGSGQASGTTTFQFNEGVNWWCPSQSYFHMRVRIAHGDGSVINNVVAPGTASSFVTYCDNFVPTLFTQLLAYVNSEQFETVNQPWIMDTALTYSKAHWNFIKTYASLSRIGEGLQTRLLNVSINDGEIEVIFRPPSSLFDVKILPPGAQFRFDFNWASSAVRAFESLQLNPIIIDTTNATSYNMTIKSFSFFKASLTPAPGLPLPRRGIIDLFPCVSNQYYMSATDQIQANMTLPGTTNRILVVFQDIATGTTSTTAIPANVITAVGGGYNPNTSFSSVFVNQAATANPDFITGTVKLKQLYLTLPELGLTEPKPPYNNLDLTNLDMIRAYSDWAHICQGTYSNYEGSLPYGNNDPAKGTQLLYINTAEAPPTTLTTLKAALATSNMQPGDPNNYQQFCAWGITAAASVGASYDAKSYNQTSRWGWSGTRPGPIFAFPVVRPDNKKITQGILYVTLTAACKSVAATVLATYSMGLAVEDVTGMGIYSYQLIQGV